MGKEKIDVIGSLDPPKIDEIDLIAQDNRGRRRRQKPEANKYEHQILEI